VSEEIAGKVAWVTGASSGIGAALAHELAAKGAAVVLSSRREEKLRNVQEACDQPERHFVLPLDMLRPESFAPAVDTVLGRLGRVDILIHCAGQSQRGRAVETDISIDRHIMELNFFATVALTKHVLPSMLERRAGHIVPISSLLGKFAARERSAYCASKHALHGFFDALRAEVYDYGVWVTMICPGFVRTNVSYNALTADGRPHGQLDHEIRHGLASDECARQIVRAVERRRREVYIGGTERLGVFASRFAPRLFSRYMRLRKLR
jgi:dehydrogenase/reductase SDR family member 7B